MYAVKERNLDHFYKLYCQKGRAALTALVCAGERLVRHFARIYNGEKCEDTLQAGRVGLIKAVRRFDPSKGASFSTYASHCIKGEIRHYLRQEALYYRPGVAQDLRYRLDRYVAKVLQERGELPTPEEIAQALQVKKTKIVQAMRASIISLEEADLTQFAYMQAEDKLSLADKLALQQAIDCLNELQREVIYLLFFQDLTQTEAGKKLDIQQRKVSTILHHGLRELAKQLES
ncbi:MAG: sigma-70 family RNA polymerase sigma factor [Firmicutes bacterium]|nr:sigma-70 family RNA polymerase sigma factor [Bacillota bacterium]